MKKTKKLIALFIAAVMASASVMSASAGLNITPQSYSASPMSIVGTSIPVTGIAAVDSAVRAWVNEFTGRNAMSFDINGDGPVISWTVEDANDRFSALTVTVGLLSSARSGQTRTFYIDTQDGVLFADESAYQAAIAAAEEEDEEEPIEEDETGDDETEPEYIVEVDLNELVPVRLIAEDYGLDVQWNSELKGVELLNEDGESLVLFVVGVDLYVTEEDGIELGVAPELIDGVTYVPASFFVYLLGIDEEELYDYLDVQFVEVEGGGSAAAEAEPEELPSVKALSTSLPEKNPDMPGSQAGWLFQESGSRGLTIDDLLNYEYLILEFAEAPSGGAQMSWRCEDIGVGWNSMNIIGDLGLADTRLVLKLSDWLREYELLYEAPYAIIFLCYYSPDLSGFRLTNAFLAMDSDATLD